MSEDTEDRNSLNALASFIVDGKVTVNVKADAARMILSEDFTEDDLECMKAFPIRAFVIDVDDLELRSSDHGRIRRILCAMNKGAGIRVFTVTDSESVSLYHSESLDYPMPIEDDVESIATRLCIGVANAWVKPRALVVRLSDEEEADEEAQRKMRVYIVQARETAGQLHG